MRTLDHDIFPEDYIRNIITEDDQYMEAFVKSNQQNRSSYMYYAYLPFVCLGIVKKQPLQIYINACERLKLEPSRYMRQRLTSQSLTKLCLDRQSMTKYPHFAYPNADQISLF
jgi:hypothetical protein